MTDRNRVEFIESYIKVQGGDYQWSDNHGELIRCRNCKWWNEQECDCNIRTGYFPASPDWYCADGKKKGEET